LAEALDASEIVSPVYAIFLAEDKKSQVRGDGKKGMGGACNKRSLF